MEENDSWLRVWSGIRELIEFFADRLVFIGGVAVFCHVNADQAARVFIEVSHDGDFYISRADFSDLRDLEEVTDNRRLKKHEITKAGISFDIYVEHEHGLMLKYGDVLDGSVVLDGVRVAALEHLLLLKLAAYRERQGSAKGRKDERDLIKIGYLLGKNGVNLALFSGHLTKEMATMFADIEQSPEFLVVCGGNAHRARQLRDMFKKTAIAITKRWKP